MPLVSRAVILTIFWPAFIPAARGDDWPQWRGPHRDGVWSETGIVEKFPDKQLKIDWRAPIGPGYSGPTVADGRVYVTDRAESKKGERVFASTPKPAKRFGPIPTIAAIDIGYGDGPRAAVTIDSGRAYALGAMGDLHCFDAAKGDVLWKKDLLAEYKIRMPIWGITAAPLVEGNLLIVEIGGEQACIVAFDKATGEEKWKSLDDRAGLRRADHHRASRPPRARLLDGRQHRGPRSGQRRAALEASLQAGENGAQRGHAGRA